MKQFFKLSGIPDTDYVYDIETFPNIFTIIITHCATLKKVTYEISDRVNQYYELMDTLYYLKETNARLVGFNSIGFDYPVLHFIIKAGPTVTVAEIYNKAMSIIRSVDRFGHIIWPKDCFIQQVDLYKIHHYDNKSRPTGLKMLEINMGMEDVEDLPFPVGTILNDEQKDVLLEYNDHDVIATFLFYLETLDMIKSREQMSERFGIDMINHNDTKIGKDYFVKKLEEAMPGSCYSYVNGKREVKQTIRDTVDLRSVILPTIQFESKELQRVHSWLCTQVIRETKGVFTDLSATVNGFTFDFGTGGIHGSIESAKVSTGDGKVLVDWDVASYYPNLAIANGFYPEHLSQTFCQIYKEVYEERKKYPKGTVENAAFKLALNGVYGDSNNVYSPFYDPAYTMAITINGQLLLCMLSEQLMKIPGLEMIQANTDGVTVLCPEQYIDHMNEVCKWWESYTSLTLESSNYKHMYIRDVNNYIAVYDDGKLKRKGAYCYDADFIAAGEWYKDFSMMIVAKAAEAALVHGEDVAEFIHNHTKLTDFLISVKVPRNAELVQMLPDGTDEVLPNVVRYVVTTDGNPLFKKMPSLGVVGTYKKANGVTQEQYNAVMQETNGEWDERVCTKNKSKYEDRRNGVQAGQTVTICNNLQSLLHVNIDYDYYIKQAEKLVNPILKG